MTIYLTPALASLNGGLRLCRVVGFAACADKLRTGYRGCTAYDEAATRQKPE